MSEGQEICIFAKAENRALMGRVLKLYGVAYSEDADFGYSEYSYHGGEEGMASLEAALAKFLELHGERGTGRLDHSQRDSLLSAAIKRFHNEEENS